MNKKEEALLESIREDGIGSVAIHSVEDANDLINQIRGPKGLLSALAKDVRVDDLEWLKAEIDTFRDEFSIYIR